MIPRSAEWIERVRICNERRAALAEKFGLTPGQRRGLTMSLVDQLENCKDDRTRRVLLGISQGIDHEGNCEGV